MQHAYSCMHLYLQHALLVSQMQASSCCVACSRCSGEAAHMQRRGHGRRHHSSLAVDRSSARVGALRDEGGRYCEAAEDI